MREGLSTEESFPQNSVRQQAGGEVATELCQAGDRVAWCSPGGSGQRGGEVTCPAGLLRGLGIADFSMAEEGVKLEDGNKWVLF